MGRSVSYLNRAKHIVYFPYPMISVLMEDEETGEETWEESDEGEEWCEVEALLIERITEAVPSLNRRLSNDRWENREVLIMLENGQCEIGYSEYCGLCSLSIRANEHALEYTQTDEEWKEEYNKSIKWIDENWPLIEAAIPYEIYNRVGGFSNGESIYEKKDNQ